MRLHTVLAIIAAIVLAVMVFSPEAEARIPKRKLAVIKRIGLALILLKGKKKTLFPLPIPLPLPLPVVKHLQPEPYPEPVHEPVYLPAPEQSYSAPSYSSQQSYGGGMDLSAYGGNEGLY